MRSLLLEELTWPEIRAALDSGMRTVIIYCSSIEQHGPQLVEATDAVLAYHEALELAGRLGNALAAPVIRPGLSAHHMHMPGTITLRPEVFRSLVEDYISAYVMHGFDTIILTSSHGGNFAALEQIAEEASARFPDIRIISGFSRKDIREVLDSIEAEEGLPLGACDFETSVMRFFHEEYVRMDQARPGLTGIITEEIRAQFFREGVDSVSPIGVLGDPSRADPARGKKYFDALMDRQEEVIRRKLGMPPAER